MKTSDKIIIEKLKLIVKMQARENRSPRTSSLREKGNRKAGGQPGHEGKTLEMTDTPDEIIEHRACFCPECGKDVSNQPFEFFGKRQIIDIPTIKQVVTEHRVYRCRCTCGKIVESDFRKSGQIREEY